MEEPKIVYAPKDQDITISKWKVRDGARISSGSLILMYYEASGSAKDLKRLKATTFGIVSKRLFKEGDLVAKGSPLVELDECSHTTVIKDMCAECGQDLREDEGNAPTEQASVPMIHAVPDLKVTQKLAQKLGKADTDRLLTDRKLVLLVDLDQTLIHTTNDNIPNNLKDVYHFQLYGPNSPWYHTRLRPGALEFLAKMDPIYELHICTFGARNYAHMIAQFLDEDGRLFSHRILSRDECLNATSKKDNLKSLFPGTCGDSMVCIIDDREDVWNMASNLIQVKPYHFFQHTGDINAPPGLAKHELDGKGVDFIKDIQKKPKKPQKKQKPKIETASPNDSGSEDEAPSTDSQEGADKQKLEESSDSSDCVEPKKDLNEPVKEESQPPKADEAEIKEVNNLNINESLEKIEIVEEITEPKETIKSESETEKIKDLVPESSTSTVKESAPKVEGLTKKIKEKTKKTPRGAKTPEPREEKSLDADEHLIEVEDPDDYLLYLEQVLRKIHQKFYNIYESTNEIPDLKVLIPKVKSEVLVNISIVFSGLVPNHSSLEQSKPYQIAKSLGANVTENFDEKTTHLVAACTGTNKVNSARKLNKVKVVQPDWLWTCAERWEHVEERLFPLSSSKNSRMRQPPPHCHSPEHSAQYPEPKFIDTINPLLSFSNDDIEAMHDEFDEFFESDTSSDASVDIENPPVTKTLRLKRRRDAVEDNQKMFTQSEAKKINLSAMQEENSSTNDLEATGGEDDDEMPSTKFRRGEALPSDLDMEMNSDGSQSGNDALEDDSEWNMMGAELEREFLGLEK